MKTQEEIKNRFIERQKNDYFGFEISEYLDFMTFDTAKSLDLLKEGVTLEKWHEEVFVVATKENVMKKMLKYMEFAWEKANGCRGISANRSISHFKAWLWLMNDGNLEKMNAIEYEHYGKEKLIFICEAYGWDWKQWDDGVRTNY